MSATDVTRKWLREAFREEIENYMPGDTERQEDVSYDLTDYLYHLATDSTSQVNSVTSAERSYNRSVQRTNYGGDWSDEDVLLGYMIHKQERNALEEKEVSDILQVIFPTFI